MRRKGREEKKSNGCTFSFCQEKPLEAKGPFGDNVIKNPARFIYVFIIFCHPPSVSSFYRPPIAERLAIPLKLSAAFSL